MTITTAHAGTSVDVTQRLHRYALTMTFRLLCFLAAAIFAHGWLQWALFAATIFLPYMAVLAANQANEQGRHTQAPATEPSPAPALSATVEGDVIEGVVLDDSSDDVTRRGQRTRTP